MRNLAKCRTVFSGLTIILAFVICLTAAPPLAHGEQWVNFDGNYYSRQYRYGFKINGTTGIATISNSPTFKPGDVILYFNQDSPRTFVGVQVCTDGRRHPVRGSLSSDGSLDMTIQGCGAGGTASWRMTRTDQVQGGVALKAYQPGIPHAAQTPTLALPPNQDGEYSRLLDQIVLEDSKSWAANRYDPGSMSNVTIQQYPDGKRKIFKGYYRYNNGKPGWVEAEFIGNHLSCLHYWDRTDCRAIGHGAGAEMEEAARRERDHPTVQAPASQSSSWGSGKDPWGSALCNKMLGTSAWNIMSPCN